MTRKEAIEILKDLWRTKYSIYLEADIRKSLEMAIQALEQEEQTGMIAKIEIYNDNGELVSKYAAPPYDKRIDYFDDYEVYEYRFKFVYAEYKPKRQEENYDTSGTL